MTVDLAVEEKTYQFYFFYYGREVEEFSVQRGGQCQVYFLSQCEDAPMGVIRRNPLQTAQPSP